MSPHVKRINQGLAVCSPSLALMKYWGKAETKGNYPATPSLAITLRDLRTETRVYTMSSSGLVSKPRDLVIVNDQIQEPLRYEDYFAALRTKLGNDRVFWVESKNSFPTASGLASSSSGFAALTCAAFQAAGAALDADTLSSISRIGSASAARCLHGGFTILDAGAAHARPLLGSEHWPELRVMVVRVKEGQKEVSSRQAMESSRVSSPFYQAWVKDAAELVPQAIRALENRDLEVLGSLMNRSYSRMFATMLGCEPPILYWHPDSIGLIRLCAGLRAQGVQAWETMDAGPQVKIFCLAQDTEYIGKVLTEQFTNLTWMIDQAGPGPRYPDKPEILGDPHIHITQAAASLGIDL